MRKMGSNVTLNSNLRLNQDRSRSNMPSPLGANQSTNLSPIKPMDSPMSHERNAAMHNTISGMNADDMS
jgi:hypothetical protein